MTKTPAQTAHEARNAASKAAADQRRSERRLDHVARNEDVAACAAQTRAIVAELKAFDHLRLQDETAAAAIQRKAARVAAHQTRNEQAALASATLAFAEEVEARFGIIANDNAAIAQAA